MMTSQGSRAASVQERRFPQIDALKGVSILAVVLIHALRPRWDPAVSRAEVWLGDLTRFAVPSFLFASGFLYATATRGAAIPGRLRRVLLPYLVASLGALLFWEIHGGKPDGSVWRDLLLGSSFGAYYYVFVLVCLVLVTPLFARLGPTMFASVTTALIGSQWFVETEILGPMDQFWKARNPLLWWGYFLAGWAVRRAEPQVRATLAKHGRASIASLGVALSVIAGILAAIDVPSLLQRTLAWLAIWVTIALLYAAWSRAAAVPPWLRWLSDATYATYLIHLFFVIPVQETVPGAPHAIEPVAVLVPWFAGIAGSAAVIVVARALLGPRSRDLVGA